MLAFTPDNEQAIETFRRTHQVVSAPMGGAAWFEMRRLPNEGGAMDQPAITMQRLDWLEQVHNDVVREELASRREKKKKTDG